MVSINKCVICGREVKSGTFVKDIGFMCQKHQHQYYEKGKITDPTPYSIRDKENEYVEYDDHYEIILRSCSKGYEEVGRCIIDKEDYEICKPHRWRLVTHTNKYGIRYDVLTGSKTTKMISIHRFLTNCKDDLVVDHKDGNPLNNRRNNLRICTQRENVCNKTNLQSNNTTGINGVYIDKRQKLKKWIAEIRYKNTKIYLSAFEKLEDAVYCRFFAENILFKEYRATTRDEELINYINKCNDKTNIEDKVKNRILTILNRKGIDYSGIDLDYKYNPTQNK